MGKGKAKSLEEKEMIVNVHQTFQAEKKQLLEFLDKVNLGRQGRKIKAEDIPIKFMNVSKRTADSLKVGERTVERIVREYNAWDVVSTPKPKLGKRRMEVDCFIEGVIRRTVLLAYSNKIFPTLDYLHQTLLGDPNFPRMSRMTLYRICKRQLKFKFGKFEGKPVAFDRPDIAAHREKYLRQIQWFRENSYQIFYQDESWISENHSPSSGWHIPEQEVLGNGHNSQYRDPWLRGIGYRFQEGLLGGVASKPSGAGKRVILIDVGSEDGFLGPGKQFVGKKNTADYHNEMNAAHFEEWFREVIAEMPDKSVIVLDQASYHKAITPETKHPNSSYRKPEIIAWLEQRNITPPIHLDHFGQLTVKELLELANENRIPKQMEVEKAIEEENLKPGKSLLKREIHLLWLPVAHCELNPIELIWAGVKGEVRKKNKTFKIKDLLPLSREVIHSDEMNQLWAACCRHVIEVENFLKEKERIAEPFIRTKIGPIIIPLGEDSSDSSESSSSDTEEE